MVERGALLLVVARTQLRALLVEGPQVVRVAVLEDRQPHARTTLRGRANLSRTWPARGPSRETPAYLRALR